MGMKYVDDRISKIVSKFDSAISELNHQIIEFSIGIKDDVREGWYEFGILDGVYDRTGIVTLISFNGFETYKEYGYYIKGLTNRVIVEIKTEIATKPTNSDKLAYIIESLQGYKKNLIDFGYPIATDYFGNYIMKSPVDVPLPYKLPEDYIESNKLEEELVYEIENNCFEHYIRIKFNCVSEIIANLIAQQVIIEKLIPNIDGILNEIKEVIQKSPQKTDIIIEPMEEIDLPEGTVLPNKKFKIGRLTLNQTIILFHYFKQNDLILPYLNDPLCTIVSSLTGHSRQNLRKAIGYDKLPDILSDKEDTRPATLRKQDNANFKQIKNALNEVLEILENQMDKNKKSNSPD